MKPLVSTHKFSLFDKNLSGSLNNGLTGVHFQSTNSVLKEMKLNKSFMIWLSAFLFSQEGLTHIHKRPYLPIRTQGFNFKYKSYLHVSKARFVSQTKICAATFSSGLSCSKAG